MCRYAMNFRMWQFLNQVEKHHMLVPNRSSEVTSSNVSGIVAIMTDGLCCFRHFTGEWCFCNFPLGARYRLA